MISSNELNVTKKIEQNLCERGTQNRSGEDDKIFWPFNNYIGIILMQRHQSFWIQLFREIENMVNEFEIKNNTEVHKGSIYFNVGLLYLHSGDFDNTLYYWVKAEDEDRKTHGQVIYSIFTSDLFRENLGKEIKQFIERELPIENALYRSLTGANFEYEVFENHLNAIDNYLPIFLTNIYKRIRYNELEPNEATSTLYYHLVSDCCAMFEALLKKHLRNKSWLSQDVLGRIIRNDLYRATIGDISNIITSDVGIQFPCDSVSEYNTVLPSLLTQLDAESNSLRIAGLLLHLITITRNQVLHDFDITNVIYGDIEVCKRIIRISFIMELFDEYI